MTVEELDALAAERLEDAKALLGAGRHAGAYYICGYAVELKLKARISRGLNWARYPPENSPPDLSRALKTHNLRVLLMLSGRKQTMITAYPGEWAVVAEWDPERRYKADTVTAPDAHSMIAATSALLPIL